MQLEPFERLASALAIGVLVGVERGWQERDASEGARTAGLRTYALSGLLGGVAGLLSQTLGGWALAAIGLPFAAAFILFKQREQRQAHDYSVTDVVAALLVFALGAYTTSGDWQIAMAAAVAATGLLALKRVLHTWLRRLTWPELRGALVLLAMSFIALPLLPNRGFGPFAAINPYELWFLTIAMAGVSFTAYAAMRIFGPSRGVMVASVTGALVSSTAVTLYLARLSRDAPASTVANVGGAFLASGVMAGRIGLIVGVLAPDLMARLAAPLGVFAGVSILLGLAASCCALGRPEGATAPTALPVKSPLDLNIVLKFALVLGVVLVATRILSALYGVQGLFPTAALGGLADADAVTVAVARMTGGGLDPGSGVAAILLAVAANGLAKAVTAGLAGGARFAALYAGGTALATGVAALAFVWTV